MTTPAPTTRLSSPGLSRRSPIEDSVEWPGVDHLGGRRPAAPGRRHRERHVAQTADRMGVGRADDLHAGTQRVADVLAAEVEPVGEPVDLQGHALLECDLEHLVEVERVLGPAVDVAPLWMAEAAHG